MKIVLVGNAVDGFQFFGPFPDIEDALEFTERIRQDAWIIADLTPATED